MLILVTHLEKEDKEILNAEKKSLSLYPHFNKGKNELNKDIK